MALLQLVRTQSAFESLETRSAPVGMWAAALAAAASSCPEKGHGPATFVRRGKTLDLMPDFHMCVVPHAVIRMR